VAGRHVRACGVVAALLLTLAAIGCGDDDSGPGVFTTATTAELGVVFEDETTLPSGGTSVEQATTAPESTATSGVALKGTFPVSDQNGYTYNLELDLTVMRGVAPVVNAEPGKAGFWVDAVGTLTLHNTTDGRDTPYGRENGFLVEFLWPHASLPQPSEEYACNGFGVRAFCKIGRLQFLPASATARLPVDGSVTLPLEPQTGAAQYHEATAEQVAERLSNGELPPYLWIHGVSFNPICGQLNGDSYSPIHCSSVQAS
jgi:hypothetical protein